MVLLRPHETLQPPHVVGVGHIEWIQVDTRPVDHFRELRGNRRMASRRTVEQYSGRTIDRMQISVAVVEIAVPVRKEAQAGRGANLDEGEWAVQQSE
jgi:hypothetical protein